MTVLRRGAASFNPFEYLVALLKHADKTEATPEAWMPWNYRQALGKLEA